MYLKQQIGVTSSGFTGNLYDKDAVAAYVEYSETPDKDTYVLGVEIPGEYRFKVWSMETLKLVLDTPILFNVKTLWFSVTRPSWVKLLHRFKDYNLTLETSPPWWGYREPMWLKREYF